MYTHTHTHMCVRARECVYVYTYTYASSTRAERRGRGLMDQGTAASDSASFVTAQVSATPRQVILFYFVEKKWIRGQREVASEVAATRCQALHTGPAFSAPKNLCRPRLLPPWRLCDPSACALFIL